MLLDNCDAIIMEFSYGVLFFILMLLVAFSSEGIFSNQTLFGCFGIPRDPNIP
jgi:hypothetical protein